MKYEGNLTDPEWYFVLRLSCLLVRLCFDLFSTFCLDAKG